MDGGGESVVVVVAVGPRGQSDSFLTSSSISDCLDGQLSLCVSLYWSVQQRQTVCLSVSMRVCVCVCQRAPLHS